MGNLGLYGRELIRNNARRKSFLKGYLGFHPGSETYLVIKYLVICLSIYIFLYSFSSAKWWSLLASIAVNLFTNCQFTNTKISKNANFYYQDK